MSRFRARVNSVRCGRHDDFSPFVSSRQPTGRRNLGRPFLCLACRWDAPSLTGAGVTIDCNLGSGRTETLRSRWPRRAASGGRGIIRPLGSGLASSLPRCGDRTRALGRGPSRASRQLQSAAHRSRRATRARGCRRGPWRPVRRLHDVRERWPRTHSTKKSSTPRMQRTEAALPHMRHRRGPSASASASLIWWSLAGALSRLHTVQTFSSLMKSAQPTDGDLTRP